MELRYAVRRLVLFIFSMCFQSYVCKGIEVTTPIGTFVGTLSRVVVNGETRNIMEFLGIPYAKPPVGDLRFRKPERIDKMKQKFNATSYGSICPQGGLQLVPLDLFSVSEDCLSLNIFAPEPSNENSSFAVMVYIHGGAFVTGASTFYTSDVLSANGNVIVVTFNYRISILGFLATDDDASRGNFGLWDQHHAISWVHDNIASFNGDPKRVTIFGQSAGALCVVYQALYPGNRGKFQRIIAESGTPVNFGALNVAPAINYKTVGHMLGCSFISSNDSVDCLRRKDDEEIMSLLELSFFQIPFGPVFDGEFILADPQEMLNNSNIRYSEVRSFFSSLEMLIGGNSMEGAIYMTFLWKALLQNTDMENFHVSEDQFKEIIIPNVLNQIYKQELPDIAVNAVQMRYSDVIDPFNQFRLRDMLLKLSTDYVFTVPILNTAILHSDLSVSSNTFVYEFKTKSSLSIGKMASPSWVQEANHGDESAFVFGFSRRMLHSLNIEAVYSPRPEEMVLSKQMMKLWSNFAKTGTPNSPEAVTDCPYWPPFSKDTKKYLELSTNLTESSVSNGYGEPGGSFWLEFMPFILKSVLIENILEARCVNAGKEKRSEIKMDISKVVIIILGILILLLVVAIIVLCLRKKSKPESAYMYDAVEMSK